MVNVEAALSHLGNPGCFHIVLLICLGLNNVIVVMNHLAMVLYAPTTPHQCQVPTDWHNSTAYSDYTVTTDTCSLHINESVNGSWQNTERDCPGAWNYTASDREYNIIMQFDLVCGNHYLIHLSTTIYFSGVMVGGLIFGTLSDLFGRKPFLLLTQFSQIGIGVWLAFASSFPLFIALRFMQGILMQGLQTASIVLMMELFPRKFSTLVGASFEIFWALGVIYLGGLGYLIQHWSYIQLAISVPSVVTVFYIWLVPESIRWLIVHKNIATAEAILKKAARFNRITLPNDPLQSKIDIMEMCVSNGDNITSCKQENGALLQRNTNGNCNKSGIKHGKTYNLFDIFKTPEIRRRSFIQFYIWFVAACTYYGISLRLTSLAGNKYLNLIYVGLCELVPYCAALGILPRFGRKYPLVFYFLVGGITGVAAGVTSILFARDAALADLRWVTTTLAVLSRVAMAGCFSVLFLYSAELFPTIIRNVGLGACTFCMRIGAMLAPQILLLGDKTYVFLPIIIFGCMCLVAGIVSLLLPETRDAKLPEFIEDIEKSSKSYKVENISMQSDHQNKLASNSDIKLSSDAMTTENLLNGNTV